VLLLPVLAVFVEACKERGVLACSQDFGAFVVPIDDGRPQGSPVVEFQVGAAPGDVVDDPLDGLGKFSLVQNHDQGALTFQSGAHELGDGALVDV